MNTVGGYICGCIGGYTMAKDGSNRCSPNDCQPMNVKGAQPCTGKVGDVCHLAETAEFGYQCEGRFECDAKTLNFQGWGRCNRTQCAPYKAPHAVNTCTGKHGDKCALLCEFGHEQSGVPVCQGTSFTQEVCTVKSVHSCDHFGLDIINGTCGDRDGIIGCPTEVTYFQADEFCRGEGARLCSIDELDQGWIDGTEGRCPSLAKKRVWTQSTCEGGVLTRSAGTRFADYEHARHQCAHLSELLAVKCCADEAPAPVVDVCTPQYNNGGCDDKCYNDVNSLSGRTCACERPFHELADDGASCDLICPKGMKEDGLNCVEQALPGFKFLSFGSTAKYPVQVGKLLWENATFGECKKISFETPFFDDDVVQLFVTPSLDDLGVDDSARPFILWTETINPTWFRVCYDEIGYHTPKDGQMVSLYVNWVASASLTRPVATGEMSLSSFSSNQSQWFDISATPHFQNIFTRDSDDNLVADKFHVFTTPNHRRGGVSDLSGFRGDSLKHNAVTTWLERTDERGVTIGVEEIWSEKGWPHAVHTNVDYLMFKEWAGMRDEGVAAGIAVMGGAEAVRPKKAIGTNGADNLMFESPARSGQCRFVQVTAPGERLATPPVVLVTANHRTDTRAPYDHDRYSSRHNGLVAWVEHFSDKGMRVCYKDLSRYSQKHGASIAIDWMVVM